MHTTPERISPGAPNPPRAARLSGPCPRVRTAARA